MASEIKDGISSGKVTIYPTDGSWFGHQEQCALLMASLSTLHPENIL